MAFPFILAAAALLVFFNVINHPFVHDDIVFILQNPHIAQLNNLGDIFFQSRLQNAGDVINSYYRPILDVFYRLEYRLFGFNAAGFHFVNILIHAINGLILFAILCRLNFQRTLSFVVSLMFLIHPVQTEAVDCVAGVSNLLSALFVFWALHSYILHRYLLALLTFVLALLTKEQAIVALPLIILIDAYQGKNHKYFLWFMFAFITVAFLALRTLITGSHLMDEILSSPGELKLRILSIPQTLLMDLRLIVVPYDLHYYRNIDILAETRGSFLGLAALLVGIAFVTKKLSMIRGPIYFGLGWFLICLLPVLNIIPLINEYSFIFAAEHFLYLPMIGVVLALALILKQVLSSRGLKLLTVLICLSFMMLSMIQNTFWKNEVSLFERMIRFEPNFGRGHILLAKAYYEQHDIDRAIAHYLKALEIMKDYEQKANNEQSRNFYRGFIKDILKSIGELLMQKGEFQRALEFLQQVLAVDSKSKDFALLNDLAVCYIQLSDKSKAEEYFKLSLGLNPSYQPARDNLNKLLSSN